MKVSEINQHKIKESKTASNYLKLKQKKSKNQPYQLTFSPFTLD